MGEDRQSTRAFLEEMLEGTTGDVYVCSVSNKKGDGPGERHVSSRDVDKIIRFVERWDQPRRAVYYSIGMIEHGKTRNRNNAVENSFIGADVDPGPGESAGRVSERLGNLPKPPTRVHLTGRGVHGLWRLDRATGDRERFDALARQLREEVGGDPSFDPHCASLMRLPGTHNTKDGAWDEVTVTLSSNTRYSLEDIEAWLGRGASNPYLEAANLLQFKPPMDVEAELASMEEGTIHSTQLRAAASLLNGGASEDEAVATLITATRRVGSPDWDWSREERDLRKMCEDWTRKRSRDEGVGERVNVVSIKSRQGANSSSHANSAPRVNAIPTIDEGEPEDKPKGKKSKKDKSTHVVLGKAVLNAIRARGDDLMLIEEVAWRYVDSVWTIMAPSLAKAWLDKEVEIACRELKVPSASRIVNEARYWLLRNPDLFENDVHWDAHGAVPVRNGLVDPQSMTLRAVTSRDFATYRVEADYAPDAECPLWERLLADAFPSDPDTMSFLQEAVGAALMENKPRSLTRAVVLVGPSNGGKSTLIKVISDFLSPTVNSTPFDALENAHGAMAFLKRDPWILHEAFDQSKWHFSAMVKALLSGDPINVNLKNGPMVSRVFKSPVFWGANSPPQFKEASKAMENRIIIILCHRVFDQKNPTGVALEAVQHGYDGPAQMILDRERSGILNWALAGWLRLKARGHFLATEDMESAAKSMRIDANMAIGFMDECVEYDSGKMVSKPDLHAAFTAWWRENKGEGGKRPSPEALGRAISALYDDRIAVDKTLVLGGGLRFYAGVALNEAGLDLWSSAANESAAKGDGGRISSAIDEVNREIPGSWSSKAVVQKMRITHDKRRE